MKTDNISMALIIVAVAFLVLAAVVGTVVIDDVVSWMPRPGVSQADVGYLQEAIPAIAMSALVLGSLIASAVILLVFVLLRPRAVERGWEHC